MTQCRLSASVEKYEICSTFLDEFRKRPFDLSREDCGERYVGHPGLPKKNATVVGAAYSDEFGTPKFRPSPHLTR